MVIVSTGHRMKGEHEWAYLVVTVGKTSPACVSVLFKGVLVEELGQP